MPVATQTENVQGAQWTTAYVDSLPDSSFAYVNGNVRKLPYKDKNGKVDLPHVRNALARLNQTQGIPDDEKAKIRTKLQNALKNTQAADDVSLRTTFAIQADATTNELPTRMMLLRAGNFYTQKYGEVPLAASDLEEMAENFHNGVGMAGSGETGIPVDYSHESHKNAAAWIKDMAVENGDELWATDIEWSTSGKQAILGKEYKCLSSDFYPAAFGEWVDAESGIAAKNVIVGAALTNRPMFTGNQPVIASDGEAEATGVKTVIYVNASQTIKEKRMNLDQLRVKAAEDLKGDEYKFINEHQDELSAEERAKFGLKAAAEETEEQKKAREEDEQKKAAVAAADTQAASVQAAELKASADKIAALEASIASLQASSQANETEKMKNIVLAAAKRGAIKADRVDSYTARLVGAQGEDREELIADLEALASNPLLAHTYGSQQTEGSAAMDVEAEIVKKAAELVAAAEAKGEKLDIFTARKQVLAANADLEARSVASVQASAAGFDPFAGAWGANAAGLKGVNPEVVK